MSSQSASAILITAIAALAVGFSAEARRQTTAGSSPAPSAAAPQVADSFAAAMQDGETALAQRRFLSALEGFKRANALHNKTSPEAWLGMSRALYAQGVFPDALKSADQALTHARSQPALEGRIRHQRALALVARAEFPDDPKLPDAEREFAAAGKLDRALARPSYERGLGLLTAYRDAEGLRELRAYVASGGDTATLDRARRMIANPRLARERFAAPAFSLTTSTGQTLSSTNLRGEVVLLDFWGSWCPPCVANTPGLVALHQKYGNRDRHDWRGRR